MKMQKVLKICTWLLFITAVSFLMKMCSRVFVGDWFPVNTTSMTPTIVPGDKIWVNKLIFGARIYKNLDFIEGKPLESFRVKGWRKIRQGDVVVFNAPIQKSDSDSIKFKIDYVYVKRCMGVPGDTVLLPRVQRHSIEGRVNGREPQRYSGVVYVPKKGDTLYLTRNNRGLYRAVIEYESHYSASQRYHVFQNNYYFMCGDNSLQSYDSRYFGFVPEEFVIGVSRRVLFNNQNGWKQKWKERRIFKRLK